jgi:small conductance mechanosensitive channel
VENFNQWLTIAQEVAIEFGLNLLAAIVIFVIGRWLANTIAQLVKRIMARKEVDVMLVNFISTIVYYALFAFAIIAALNRLGIQTASIIAVVGAAGLAIGLALQGSLSNFAAGVLMIFFRPFSIGDFIEGGGTMGTVKEITLFTTTLLAPDNKVIIVPNAKLNGDNITNFNVLGQRRMDLVFGVSYDANIDQVKQIMAEEIQKESRFLKDPTPTIGLLELADSSVNFAVRPWVKADDYWGVFFEFQEQVKKRLDAEGISIPFPQRDVHIFQNN